MNECCTAVALSLTLPTYLDTNRCEPTIPT